MEGTNSTILHLLLAVAVFVRKSNGQRSYLKLDQQKIDFAKRYFGVTSEQEAIDRALALLMQEERIVRRLKALRGALSRDDRAWPYS